MAAIFHSHAERFKVLIFEFRRPKIDFFGGYSEEETPVPIPNTEVKLFCADGTAREAEWESRTPPKKLYKPGIMEAEETIVPGF